MAFDAREFVADDLWLLIGVVTFALIAMVGSVGLEGAGGMIAIVGWFLLAPIFLFWGEEIADWYFEEREAPATTDRRTEDPALEELKRRYAEGEIDDAEFERRLERLVGVDGAFEEVFADGSARRNRSARDRRERESDRR